jgi:hypothetical protein
MNRPHLEVPEMLSFNEPKVEVFEVEEIKKPDSTFYSLRSFHFEFTIENSFQWISLGESYKAFCPIVMSCLYA